MANRLEREAAIRAEIQAKLEAQAAKEAALAEARKQPKAPEVEEALAAKYGAMDLETRAFNILVDLGMVDLSPEPEETENPDDNAI